MKKAIQAAVEAMGEAKRVVLAAHVNPDGDTLGCVLALTHLLRGLGKALAALVHSAQAEGLASYAVGVNTIGQAQTARDAGFAYIGGSAIHPTTSEPRSPVRFAPLPRRMRRSNWIGLPQT